MQKSDSVRLQHMLDGAKEAVSFVKGQTRIALDRDRKLALSLVRLVEVVGEAAAQVTKESQKKYPGIPWPQIIAMRNRLIHAYFDIDLDRVWKIVKDDLPPLITELEKVISDKKG